jgi:hypothetical protein
VIDPQEAGVCDICESRAGERNYRDDWCCGKCFADKVKEELGKYVKDTVRMGEPKVCGACQSVIYPGGVIYASDEDDLCLSCYMKYENEVKGGKP